MTEMRLAKTCSTCIHAQWSKGQYYYGGTKRQMGMCLGLCDGTPPAMPKEKFPVDASNRHAYSLWRNARVYMKVHGVAFYLYWPGRGQGLYEKTKKEGQLVDKDTYLGWMERDLKEALCGTEDRLRNEVENAIRDYRDELDKKERYEVRGLTSPYGSYILSNHGFPEELMDARESHLGKFLAYWPEIEKRVREQSEKYYDDFEKNFTWWQKNWPLCRTAHRVTVCDLYVESKRRETVARSVAKGGYSLHKKEEQRNV